VRMRRGERSRCHANSAAIWGTDIKKYQLVTGYALSDDGIWRQHTWVFDGKHVHETTVARVRYFGFAMGEREACMFWFANFLQARCAEPLELMQQAGMEAPKPGG